MGKTSKTFLGNKRKAQSKKTDNSIIWLELPERRPENCENNRRQFYKCKRCKKNVGQMEAISRHYAFEHPSDRSDLRNLIANKEYIFIETKIFINSLMKGSLIFGQIKNYDYIQTMIEMMYQLPTIKYLTKSSETNFKKKSTKLCCNIEKESIFKFIENAYEYSKVILKILDEFKYNVPNINEENQTKTMILFKDINLTLTYPETSKLFFIFYDASKDYPRLLDSDKDDSKNKILKGKDNRRM